VRRIEQALVFAIALLPATVFADDAADEDDYRLYAPEPCPSRGGIVGHRACPRYGEWAIDWPAVTVTFGFSMRHLAQEPAPGVARSSSVTTPTMIDDDDALSSSRYSVSEQVAIAPNPLTFLAFEVEFSPSRPEHLKPGERQFSAGSNIVAGLRGGGKLVRIGVEIAGGMRIVDSETDQDDFVLEARARGDIWVTPWLTLGVLLGSSLIDRGDWVTGISLGTHTNAFDGR
jgi:hypothetical protein